jgi:hypothetical protein
MTNEPTKAPTIDFAGMDCEGLVKFARSSMPSRIKWAADWYAALSRDK